MRERAAPTAIITTGLSRDAASLSLVLANLRPSDASELELDDMADALMAPIVRVVAALAELGAARLTTQVTAHA